MALAQNSAIYNWDDWQEVTVAGGSAAVALDALSLSSDVDTYTHSSASPSLGVLLEATMQTSPSDVGTVQLLGRRMELRGQAANHASPPSTSFLQKSLGWLDVSDAVGVAAFYTDMIIELPQSEANSKWEFIIVPRGLTGGTGLAAGWKLWLNPYALYPKP